VLLLWLEEDICGGGRRSGHSCSFCKGIVFHFLEWEGESLSAQIGIWGVAILKRMFWFTFLVFVVIIALLMDDLGFNLPPSNHLFGALYGVSDPSQILSPGVSSSSSNSTLVSFCFPLDVWDTRFCSLYSASGIRIFFRVFGRSKMFIHDLDWSNADSA